MTTRTHAHSQLSPTTQCDYSSTVITFFLMKNFNYLKTRSSVINTVLLWWPYVIEQTIIFLPCCFYLLSSFFSSPNLSSQRMDVYHTSTHGVALVQISNACLKCAARGSLKIQDAKNRHFNTIAQLCQAVSSQLRHVSTIEEKTC